MTILDLLAPDEAAAMLDLKEETLATWRAENPGKGPPYVKIGRKVYYRKPDILAWVDKQVIDPEAPKPKHEKVPHTPSVVAAKLRETLSLPRVPRGRARSTTVN